MHYKFNPFTGRLSTPSTLEVPNKYVQYGEAPTQVFITNTKLSGTDHPIYRGKFAPVPQPLQNKMRLFQVPNGLPVHIKGGPVDKVLFAITASVCLVGLVDCFRVYYQLSYPAPPSSE